LLALLLFLPVATLIATLFVDPIAEAVERRFYPWLAAPRPAAMGEQVWDGLALGARVLGMQVAALVLSLLLPGVGLLLGWLIASWAIGRGVFVAVAMRRMDRVTAGALYRSRRSSVLVQGGLMTAGNLVPLLNLVVPVLGTAAMVHVLHQPDLAREPLQTRYRS
jgi:CysZ protein